MRLDFRVAMVFSVSILVLVTGDPVWSEDSTSIDENHDVPSLIVEAYVVPLEGAMHIPPAKPPSRPYTVSIQIRDSEVGSGWSLSRLTMYAGDDIERKGEYGPYRIACNVRIDERGETAEVKIRQVEYDDADPTRITFQRFAVQLPRSQIFSN